MTNFRVGYLYSFSPIHCGGEGDIGNILEIAREVHTNFPYIPGSSWRGSVRNEVVNFGPNGGSIANRLFGKELDDAGQMGVHQVWFGDARLLWIPMRTMALEGSGDAFTWVSCPTLLRDHALILGRAVPTFRNQPIGTRSGTYWVADSKIQVTAMSQSEQTVCQLGNGWTSSLQGEVQSKWENNRLILPDSDFEILMEHSLWTQVRNKIQEAGSAEVFWTDVCIPRDTIFYFPWGYNLPKKQEVLETDHQSLMEVMSGLLQVGGQANVGRGWVQSWVVNAASPNPQRGQAVEQAPVLEA